MIHPTDASLARLEGLVDSAISALRAGAAVDHAAMADAKGRALLELTRGPQPDGSIGEAADQTRAARIGRLRAKLAEEERLLGVQLKAAEMVSGIVSDAILASEADGTYGPRPPRAGPTDRGA